MKIPDKMKATITKASKTYKAYAYFDGVDCLEIYYDENEVDWFGTYKINTKIFEYFLFKNAPFRPKIHRYTLRIPELDITCKHIKLVKVDW